MPLERCVDRYSGLVTTRNGAAVPGLRQAIRDTSSYEPHVQANAILAFLADAPAAFGVIEARP